MQWTLWGEPYTMSNLTQAGALTIYKEGMKGLPGKSQADKERTQNVAQCRCLLVCKYHKSKLYASPLCELVYFTSYAIKFVKYPKQWKDSSTQSAERVKCDSITTTHKLCQPCKLKLTVPQSMSKLGYKMAWQGQMALIWLWVN